MLRLGQSLSVVSIKNAPFMPDNISVPLTAWWKFQSKITADEDGSGSTLSPNHTTGTNTMQTNDRINQWDDFTGTYSATQTTSADKPRWNTVPSAPAEQKPNVYFDGNFWLDMDDQIDIAEEEEFSIVIECVFSNLSLKTMIGGSSTDFWRINSATGFRCKIGGAGNNNFTEASDTISTNKNYIITLSREGAAGNLSCYVHGGGSYIDKAWGSTSLTDPDAFTLSNIGASEDDTNNFEGVIKNVLIYKGGHLSTTERKDLYTYLSLLPGN